MLPHRPPEAPPTRARDGRSNRVALTKDYPIGACALPSPVVTVFLLGAGPGDPSLITVRGARVLAIADVVVHDRLSGPELLDLAPPSAELIDVGKARGMTRLTQQAINELLVEQGRLGRTVVRLKGGDPYLFGRGGEEATALQAAGVPFEVIPGVTSATAAPAAAGIPVTMRDVSPMVTVVTGQVNPEAHLVVDWEALARLGGTIVILMGVGHIAEIAERLQAGGLPASTPVAAVHGATTPSQRVVRATLATVAGLDLEAPTTIVVGSVAGLDLSSPSPETPGSDVS